jgi:hypothetical protein
MHDDDFFVELPLGPGADPWDMPEVKIRTHLVEQMRVRHPTAQQKQGIVTPAMVIGFSERTSPQSGLQQGLAALLDYDREGDGAARGAGTPPACRGWSATRHGRPPRACRTERCGVQDSAQLG